MGKFQIKTVRGRCPTLNLIGVAIESHDFSPHNIEAYHFHDMVEMIYVLDGFGQHYIEGQCLDITSGSLGIVHYQQSHRYESNGMSFMNIYFDPEKYHVPKISSDLLVYLPKVLTMHENLLHNRNRVISITFSQPDVLERYLSQLFQEQTNQRAGYLDAMKYIADLFLIECCRELHVSGQSMPPEVDYQQHSIFRLQTYLDQHFSESLGLDDLAKRFAVSKSHMCRLFRTYTGKTIIEYVHQRRIEKAIVLLKTSNKKIYEIAMLCGFPNISFFNRIFVRMTKTKPSKYRE